MKKISLFSFLLVISPLFLFSQTYLGNSTLDEFILQTNVNKLTNTNDANNGILGSPYENDEFQPGYILSKNNEKYDNVQLRFNIYNNVIDYKNENGDIYSLSFPELFEFFVIGDKKYKYYTYIPNKKIKKAYFQVITEGEKASLLLKDKVTLKKATKPGAYKEAQPASFMRMGGEYYIKVGEQEAKHVGNKKDLISILSTDIEKYIKSNKLKIGKEEDLKQIVDYYNSL